MKKQLLSALCLLASGFWLQAATVTGDMTLLFGDGATNGEFSISGLDLPMSYNGITYLADPVSGQLTNGQLNVTLTPPGRYDISFPALNTSLRIVNPANTNTYDISQLVTNIAVFVSQGISRQVLPGDGVAFVTNNLGQINETITIAAVGGTATNSYQSVAGNDLVVIITDPTNFTQTIFGISQTNNQLAAWAQIAPESKQDHSPNLDLWSAVDPSSFQPLLGYTPATTNFATTDVPGLILPDGTSLVIDPTTHKLSSVATGTGDFVGPNAATSGHVVTFGSDTGKLGQDSGHALSEYTLQSQIASGSQNGVLSSNDWATFNGKQAYSTNLDLWSALEPSAKQDALGFTPAAATPAGIANALGYTPATTNFATTDVPGLILPDGTSLVIDPTTHKLSSVATGTGDFVGPNTATSGHVVTFGSDTGKLGQDSGHALSEYTLQSQIASGSQNGVLSSNDWATFNGKQAYSTNLDLWSAVDPSSFQPLLGYTPATTNFATTEVPGLILPDGTSLVIDPTTHKLSSVATGTGDFVGPNTATSGHVVTFGSDTGKLGVDSGHALSEYTLLSQIASGSQNGVLSSNDWATFNGKQAYSTNLDLWSALEPSAKQDALGFTPAAATPAGIANALGYVPPSFAQVTQAVLSITLPIDSLAVPGQITGLGVDQNTNQVTLLFRNNLTLTATGTNNFYWVDAASGGGGSTNLATSTTPGLVKLGSPTVGIAPDGTLWATNTAGGNANNTALLRTNIYVRDTNALILDAAKAQTFNVGFIANGSTLLLSNFNAIANLGCHDIQINLHNGTNGGPGLLTLMNVMGNLTTNGAWTQTTNANATDILVARVDGTYTNVIITAQANCSTYVDTTPYLSSGGGDPPPPPPTISTIPAQSVTSDEATVAIPFTIGDAETPATSLTVSGSSSSTTLVPNANIVFGGSGANRTVTVTPAAGNTGTAQITVTVSDGTNTASSPFTLTVNTGGTGGGGGSCTPSYSNPTGVGITVFGPGSLFVGQGQSLSIRALATNNVFAKGLYFNNGLVLNGSTYWIGFDFGSPTLVTEDVFFQSSSQSQGVWKWQGASSTDGWVPGSNDGSIWTDVGGNFTLVTQNTTTNTAMSANTTKYRFYRALGMSGTTSFFPWTYQFQFKYCQ